MSETESETEEERQPKRQKRDTNNDKFQDLTSGKINKYEAEELDSIYVTMDERKYVKRVDDDGGGYVEDGRDNSDDATSKGNAGKANIQAMLSSMPSKIKKEAEIDDDDILSEILDEIDEGPSQIKEIPRSFYFSTPVWKLNQNKPRTRVKIWERKTHVKENGNETKYADISEQPEKPKVQMQDEAKIEYSESPSVFATQEDDFAQDDLDLSKIEDIESQAKEKEVQIDDDDLLSDILGEINESPSGNEKKDGDISDQPEKPKVQMQDDAKIEDSGSPLVFATQEDDLTQDDLGLSKIEVIESQAEEKVEKDLEPNVSSSTSLYENSISEPSVYVEEKRKLNEHDQVTDQPVRLLDVCEEFNDLVAKPHSISTYNLRFIEKKYAFDPLVPTEGVYMEVQYSATEPRINPVNFLTTPKTFSRIFGLNTTSLERFLLDRKIMGPCWLEISEPVAANNRISWCKYEVNCMDMSNISICEENSSPPPLIVSSLNFRSVLNPKTKENEIVMISCVTQTKYEVGKNTPEQFFNQHFCVLAPTSQLKLPSSFYENLRKYKDTRLQKMDTEKALINYFINQFSTIDPDLIVGHDLHGYQMGMLAGRLQKLNVNAFHKLGKFKRSEMNKKLDREVFLGRLVSDIKISAKELIKSRTYDLDALCQTVLKVEKCQRADLKSSEILRMFATSEDILKLVTCTMQDSGFILKIMYELNIIPLALEMTNIAGNLMSKTLLGGQSERNDFLLLHAFSEKEYIVPDKQWKRKEDQAKSTTASSTKKPTYSGGLVLEPKVGFYDTLILLMDFNSLYPSIIQEYNICFTTVPITNTEDKLVLPDKGMPTGILPVEIKKLVDSRKQVKSLMGNPDLASDLKTQYDIRQKALKLTANSMYGCLGFPNSRFYAKNLAALVAQKGREILTNTRDLVVKLGFDVIYGDTDSIMINTNSLDYDEVIQIGVQIKQEVDKVHNQVELDIDSVFKYLLLLKKKKYAAVTLTKTIDGKLKEEREYKGIDIVRRDWSTLACVTGQFVLDQILSDQPQYDKIQNIHKFLANTKKKLENGKVPLPLLIINKQLTKEPKMYVDKNALPHVQVALRFNRDHGGHFRTGDTVPYVICEDGTDKGATQRAYHPEELKSDDKLKIDKYYYLSQQVQPVVNRICEPISGIGSHEIAERLGLDRASLKKSHVLKTNENVGENIFDAEVEFRDVRKFTFKCIGCKTENPVDGPFRGNVAVLEKCVNDSCTVRPVDHLCSLQNQIEDYISKYYPTRLTCEDPACFNVTSRLPLRFEEKNPVCTMCQHCVAFRDYTEKQLYTQLKYFSYIFSPTKSSKMNLLLEEQVREGYQKLQDTISKYLNISGYATVRLEGIFATLCRKNEKKVNVDITFEHPESLSTENSDEEEEVEAFS